MNPPVNITVKLQEIEMDILEELLTPKDIAHRYGFINTGALRDFLLAHGKHAQWNTLARRLAGPQPAKKEPARRADRLPENFPRSIPTSPPKEPIMEEPQAPPERDDVPFWARISRAITAAQESPKKRTQVKADQLIDKANELLAIVEGEAEEVEARKEIEELKAKLRAAEAKLKPKAEPKVEVQEVEQHVDPQLVRAWAKRNGLTVGDSGKLSKVIIGAYEEAHRG